ncbi:P-loop containing nucleoside triphosphate hydrolase protein [Rhodocollybia butyracea]|uniref:P-loop containing nucleoside triphosphate hydrolase protein n=1 Tax=Rhodocollybia butyracea TaxID=206335 RepID=A0A9P5Q061_9AGAR|nr:P-loop containing nucleoside triphosphate hydrolase protein [Rhodocollybia butyracea]
MKFGRRQGTHSNRKGNFDPNDESSVQHTKIGQVWELYEERQPELAKIPFSTRLNLERYIGIYDRYRSIRALWLYLGVYLALQFVLSLIPAVQLWYSGQLLAIVGSAVENRTVDKQLLFQVAASRVACSLADLVLRHFSNLISRPLNTRIKQYYTIHMFGVLARLDVPTYDDPLIQRQLEQAFPTNSRQSIVWRTVVGTIHIGSTAVMLISQLSVLFRVLKDQQDGPLLALLSFAHSLLSWTSDNNSLFTRVWAATTQNDDFIKLSGLRKAIGDPAHRKEIVAGNMWEYMHSEYRRCITTLGEDAAEFFDVFNNFHQRRFPSLVSIIRRPIHELPQIVFTLRAVQYPSSIPLSLASLNLITSTTSSFSNTLLKLFIETGSISDNFATIRKMYEMIHIENRIQDGQSRIRKMLRSYRWVYRSSLVIRTEFVIYPHRNVSFKYPESNSYALNNVSFKIAKGQLCVILGQNGSGKSTILKLIARLYDPSEGQILIDDRDIKTLKLTDIRRAMAVLFQDYTHFPLSIKENIALGDPGHSSDDSRIAKAAKFGGASEFIERLEDGYDTYLDRPVRDYYSGLPEGTMNLFGRAVSFGKIKGMGGMKSSESTSLSGGQMQRIALSRTFMRSLVSEDSELGVGLLLFDEPLFLLKLIMIFSTIFPDLFERLRHLRGQKTMIFSSHRFGNLTRNADMILYMHDSVIVEEGSHEALIRAGGEYARIWNLQAQAFL